MVSSGTLEFLSLYLDFPWIEGVEQTSELDISSVELEVTWLSLETWESRFPVISDVSSGTLEILELPLYLDFPWTEEEVQVNKLDLSSDALEIL